MKRGTKRARYNTQYDSSRIATAQDAIQLSTDIHSANKKQRGDKMDTLTYVALSTADTKNTLPPITDFTSYMNQFAVQPAVQSAAPPTGQSAAPSTGQSVAPPTSQSVAPLTGQSVVQSVVQSAAPPAVQPPVESASVHHSEIDVEDSDDSDNEDEVMKYSLQKNISVGHMYAKKGHKLREKLAKKRMDLHNSYCGMLKKLEDVKTEYTKTTDELSENKKIHDALIGDETVSKIRIRRVCGKTELLNKKILTLKNTEKRLLAKLKKFEETETKNYRDAVSEVNSLIKKFGKRSLAIRKQISMKTAHEKFEKSTQYATMYYDYLISKAYSNIETFYKRKMIDVGSVQRMAHNIMSLKTKEEIFEYVYTFTITHTFDPHMMKNREKMIKACKRVKAYGKRNIYVKEHTFPMKVEKLL
jgi:hypothetical protein